MGVAWFMEFILLRNDKNNFNLGILLKMETNYMKKILAFLLVVLMLLSLMGVSCHPPVGTYRTELFVVATHSLLGVRGGDRESVFVLEEDDFGRVMFAFGGNTIIDYVIDNEPSPLFNILAVLIVQRTTRRYSYFYDGINVIFHQIALDAATRPGGYHSASGFLSEDFVMEHFTEEQLMQLKAENNWNEELSEDRFFRVRVATGDKERHMTYVSRRTQSIAFPDVLLSERDSVPLTMDRNENVIYFMGDGSRVGFLLMFDRNGDLIEGAVMRLVNLWDYRDQLREFKEANGWGFYYQ